jgi:hypothetical protein
MTSEDPTIPKTSDKDKDRAKEESPTLPADTSEDVTTEPTNESKVVIVTPTESDPKDSKKKEAKITKEHKT